MEGALTMLVHAIIIAIFLYVVMKFALNQSNEKATDRSVLIGAFVLIYMILCILELFSGHPYSIKN